MKAVTRLIQPFHHSVNPFCRVVPLFLTVALLVGSSACSSTRSSGSRQQIKLMVGEIKEITLSNRGDGSRQLVGTSDNQEVVEVSRPELAPAVDTLKRTSSGPAIFQLKGVTVGTANVVFTEKQPNEMGSGQVKKTYVVQVISK